jgi:hypothetical protein
MRANWGMQKIPHMIFKRLLPVALALATVTANCGVALAQTPATPASSGTDSNAIALLQKHATLAGQLATNSYRRPLVLESAENASTVSGDAYAVLDSPFSTVSATFKSLTRWCDVLILHINTKYCRAGEGANKSVLKVNIGKKSAQPLADAFALEFAFRQVAASPEFMATQLNAEKGPLGTSDYRMELSAVPLPEGKTFMHLRYSYGYGVTSRLAMQGYLATLGRGKVGFTASGKTQPSVYVSGVRGAVERNTMRYYLAIEAYLASLGRPPAQQLDARLQHWFDATEEYSEQLHEVGRDSYLTMKKDEYRRQQTTTQTPV